MRHALLATLLAFALAFAPEAFARAGSSKSFGSRGSRTYDRPIERSVTPPPTAAQPQAAQPMYRPDAVNRPAAGPMAQPAPAAAQGGFLSRNPFMAGMLGGLAGAGLGSLLFGHSPALAAAAEGSPAGSMLGMLLQLALIGGAVWLVVRLLRRRAQPAQAAYSAANYQADAPVHEMNHAGMSHAGAQRVAIDPSVPVTDADREEFTDILREVQAAWSEGDTERLKLVATQEIVKLLSQDLARNSSRGVRNIVEDVTLLKGNLLEAWRDDDLDFVTAELVFSCRDYTVRTADGQVVEGSRETPSEATEAWTFVRAPGGRWLLSAVERP